MFRVGLCALVLVCVSTSLCVFARAWASNCCPCARQSIYVFMHVSVYVSVSGWRDVSARAHVCVCVLVFVLCCTYTNSYTYLCW